MSKAKKSTIEVQGTAVTVINLASDEYISLTDIAKHKELDRSDHVIQNWMRNRNTIEFLGIWERLHNVNFKPLEFEGFKKQYRGDECRTYSYGFITRRTPQATQLNSHSPDAGAHIIDCDQATQGITACASL
jgi:hypothetical protein